MLDLVELFCHVDDFVKFYKLHIEPELLPDDTIQDTDAPKKRNREHRMTVSEIVTLLIQYQYSCYKNFKNFYKKHVEINLKRDFPGLLSYNRFIELKKEVFLVLALFMSTTFGKCTGISFIDSTPLAACHVKREHQNKVCKGIAKKGVCSMGWFFGFKLHAIINHIGEFLGATFTPGNVSDKNENVLKVITKNVWAKLVADKGYIGAFQMLYEKGIQLIHKLRKNMKNKLMPLEDKILLKKRGLIESVFHFVKDIFDLEHTRHRSIEGFFINYFSAIAAYGLMPKKPRISLQYYGIQG